MKKNLWSLIALLTIFSLLLAACNTPQVATLTPEEILQKSQENAANLKSAQFKLIMDIEASGVKMSITADGMIETPDKVYMKMSLMNQTMEMLMLSATEAYMKTGDSWEKIAAADLGSTGMNTGIISGQEELMKFFKNLKNINVEQVSGVNCYHIGFEMDLQKALELSADPSISSVVGEMEGTATGELWVGAEDFLTRKLVINMDLEVQGQKMKMVMTMEMFDINKPVTFPNPN